jgi:choline dehydrogenase-like flavoprotein
MQAMSRTTVCPFIAFLVASIFSLSPVFGAQPATPTAAGADQSYDIAIYGGTAGGAAAAVQASRMGKTVVLIEPGEHIGGLTSGGLGATDIGNKAAIGGISREFYRRVGEHYARDEAWKQETREQYRSGRQQSGEIEMWTFEPHVAEEIPARCWPRLA